MSITFPPFAYPDIVEERGGPFHKGGLANRRLAARGARSPVRFTASLTPKADRLPSTSRAARRQIARTTYEVLIDLAEEMPAALLGDKGYDTDPIRTDLKRRGIRAVIPPRSHRTAAIRWNKRLYRHRNRIERMLGHLKINRAIATRYDKLAESFLGMLHLAAFRYCCKFVHRT